MPVLQVTQFHVRLFWSLTLTLVTTAASVKADNQWVLPPPTPGAWSTPTNWLTPIVPLPTDNVVIGNGGTAVILGGSAASRFLFVGGSVGAASGSLEIRGGTLSSMGILLASGSFSSGSVSQSAGSVTVTTSTFRGLQIGRGGWSTGSYDLSGGSLTITQTLAVAPGLASSGTFLLSGSGVLRTGSTTVSGTGGQSGGRILVTGGSASLGTTSIFRNGLLDVSSGTVAATALSVRYGADVRVAGGELAASTLQVDNAGRLSIEEGATRSIGMTTISGSAVQNGGLFQPASLTVSAYGLVALAGGTLAIGQVDSGAASPLAVAGTLRVDGTGMVTAGKVTMSAAGSLFDQVKSQVAVGDLAVNEGTYRMQAGTLEIANSWTLGSSGTMDFASGMGIVSVAPGAAVNLSQGAIVNSGSASVAILGSDTLVILPADFEPTTAFASFTNEGTAYSVGGTLEVIAGRTVQISGTLSDPAVVAGTLRAAAGTGLALTSGLTIVTGGSVNLGSGGVVYRSGSYSMGDGVLVTGSFGVATAGTATFVQPMGTVQAGVLAVGSGAGAAGGYDLSGGSLIVLQSLTIGAGDATTTGTLTVRGSGILRGGVTTISGTGLGLAAGRGQLRMTGGSASLGTTTIGHDGVLDVLSGTLSTGLLLAGSSAMLQVTGGELNADSLSIGATSLGTLEGGVFTVGDQATVNGVFRQSGGVFRAHGASVASTGLLAITGGSLAIGAPSSGVAAPITVSGILRIDDAGRVTAGAITANAARALVDQVRSDVTVGNLAIDAGTYKMAGGTLGIATSWTLGTSGTMDFADGAGVVTVSPGATVNLSSGTIVNCGSASLTILGNDAFVILPPGLNPSTAFSSFTNEGTTYNAGGTLEILAGRSLQLSGMFSDPVIVAGTLRPEDGTNIALTGGLTVLAGGSADLGSGGSLVYQTGTFAMGPGTISTGSMVVGSGGTSSFAQAIGSIQAGRLAVGQGTFATGTYDMSGGTLTIAQTMSISSSGSQGRATFTLSGNGVLRTGVTTVSATGSGTTAGGSGSSGLLAIAGGSASLGTTSIGRGGTLEVSSGGVAAGIMTTGSGGVLRISGGSVAATSLPVAVGGRAVLEGGLVTASGAQATISGSFVQSGGIFESAALAVAPTATYALTGGTLRLGLGSSGSTPLTVSGTLRLDGSAALDTGKILMSVTSGRELVDQREANVQVGDLAITYGRYRMSGGTLGVTRTWTLGASGTMDFGTGSVTVWPGAAVNLSQGRIINTSTASLTILGTNALLIVPQGFDPTTAFRHFSNEGTTYTVGSTLIVQNGQTIDLAGTFSDPINTAGTIYLADATTLVADVSLASTGVITGVGELTVEGSAVRGSGVVATDLRITGGAVAPGFSPGTLTLGGNWTLDPSSLLSIEIFGTEADQFDRLVVGGTSTLLGTLSVTLGASLPLGASLTIIDNQSPNPILGGFGTAVSAAYGSELYTFSIDHTAGTGNDVMLTLTDISPVPEPAPLVLGLAGLAGILGVAGRGRLRSLRR
jgi:fibronectin-binding autotransporter adhesin